MAQNSLLNTKMHIPVLLREVIEILNPQPGEFFIDGTIGSAGHSLKILKEIKPKGKLLGVDWDSKTLQRFELRIKNSELRNNIILVNDNYANLPEILEKNHLSKADGLLIDLGMSSEQLEKSGRGFSFLRNEPLDMRYDTRINADINADLRGYISVDQRTYQRESAAAVINNRSEKELAEIFWKYGEEKYSRKIAKKIIEERRKKPIKTTFDLVKVILTALFNISMSDVNKLKNGEFGHGRLGRLGRLHPATRVFQALRIYINQELENLGKLLKNLDKIVTAKGRIAIISYHSLEDRLVKNRFRQLAKEGKAEILTKKPIRPTLGEVRRNPRSRSAKLRAISFA